MKEKINPYKFIPIKPYFTLNEVKRIPNKIQNHIEKILLKDDEFAQERKTKYKMFFTNLNIIRLAIREGDLDYYEEDYEDYIDDFEPILNDYSEEKLKIILKQNKAEIIGNIDELREYIKENIPSEVAEIYLWEFKARNKQNRIKFNKLTINQIKNICEIRGLNTFGRKMDLIERILIDIDEDEVDHVINHFDEEKKISQKLEGLESYKLKRILELKSEKIDGDETNINKIVKIVKLDEIDSLIEKVNNEYKSYEAKLKDLKPQELKLILSNENLNTVGNQDSIIERIFENISLNELGGIINQVKSFIERSLGKLYSIIGKTDLKDEFKETLKEYCIKESQFNEIRKEMIDLINDYQIAEKDVESELNKLLQKKSAEIEKDTLNALYKIVGKVSLNPNFFSRLESRDLDVTAGKQIRKEMEEDIKAKKVSLDNLNSAIETKIKEAEQKEENEKFHILYEYIGESEINEQFKLRLEEDNLNEEFWLKLKNELTILIKEKSIKKEEITSKVDELLNLEVVNNLLVDSDLPILNQIAILEDIETFDNKDKQMNIILDNISERFDKSILKNYISKINEVKKALDDFYQIQIVYILEKTGYDVSGKKEEQINRLISNINIKFINSYIEKFENLKEKLNSAPVIYLFIMLNENNIKVKGAKRKIINEIIKKVHFEKINEELKTIDQIHLKLNQLQENELIYIAETNKLSIDKIDSLANQIFTSIKLNIIESNLTDIENIKELVYGFNDIQRKHLLMINHQDIPESEQKQINSILLNIRLDEIVILDQRVKNAEEELNSLNVEQLNYILENNQQAPISSKEKQIDYILNNFLIEVIESNISIINKMKDELNQLSDDQLKKILNINNIEVTADRKINISRIFYEVPMEVINNNIIYVKNEVQEKTILEDIKESIVYSPRREEGKKYSLTTVRKNNLNLIPVFENKRILKDFVRNKFSDSIMNIKAIKKEFNFFKDLTLKQNNIDGIIVFRNHNIEIIKKECL